MKLVRSLVGIFAVLFSVQPLISWAAKLDNSKIIKDVKTSKPDKDGTKTNSGGAPTCGGA